MAYPWYSTGRRTVGSNRLFSITMEENCETGEIKYRADIIDRESRTGKKSIASEDLVTLKNKVLTYYNKMNVKLDGQFEDITEVFAKREQLA